MGRKIHEFKVKVSSLPHLPLYSIIKSVTFPFFVYICLSSLHHTPKPLLPHSPSNHTFQFSSYTYQTFVPYFHRPSSPTCNSLFSKSLIIHYTAFQPPLAKYTTPRHATPYCLHCTISVLTQSHPPTLFCTTSNVCMWLSFQFTAFTLIIELGTVKVFQESLRPHTWFFGR